MNRSIAKCIVFSIITCGIYALYWFVKINDELNALAGDTTAPNGVKALILTIVTCGIYGFYWAYKMGQKVDQVTGNNGNTAVIYIVLEVFGLGIVTYALIQDVINKNC